MCLLAESENLHIMVGYVFLFNETIIAHKKIIENGELGKILHLESHRTNLGPVRKDVNAVWDLSHDLSILIFYYKIARICILFRFKQIGRKCSRYFHHF